MAVEEIVILPAGEEPERQKLPKKKAGRPSSLTPETIIKLEQAFAQGCNDQEACYFADVWPASFYVYCKQHPEFLERKKALKSRPVLVARRSVNEAMKDDGWLALKFLEKKRPEEFGDKPAVVPTVTVNLSFEKQVKNYLAENPEAKSHIVKISKFLREPDGSEQANT